VNVVVPLESQSDLSIDVEFRTFYPPLLGVELKNSVFFPEKNFKKGKFYGIKLLLMSR